VQALWLVLFVKPVRWLKEESRKIKSFVQTLGQLDI